MSESMQVERVADTRCHTGEGPLWHPIEQRLYWLDIPNGHLFRLDPGTGSYERVLEADEAIGGATVQADGALLLFMARGAIRTWRDGRFLSTVVEEIQAERGSRFNDVIADPAGRVFCGTMSTPNGKKGTLYRLDLDGSVTPVVEDVGTSNGMGFTPDRQRMYFTDTPTRRIDIFDYDQATGALSNRRAFVHTDDAGRPDGMTVDAEGGVWGARWDGGVLVHYAPDGTDLGRVHFPARKVSSATFGGPDFTDVYVTTAGGPNRGPEEGDGAGALFRFRPGVRGVPEFFSRVKL
jgi:D-xylono/L-arabinono-1,4-lactonase